MEDLLRELRAHHTVHVLRQPFTADRVGRFMKVVDILYVEWCASYMVTVTQLPKTCKIVNRLLGMAVMGVGGSWLRKINWSKIDLMIFINEHPRQIFNRFVKNPPKSAVVKLGVNLKKFTLKPNRGYGKRLGFVGHFKTRKNPYPVIEMMSKLPDWTLKVRCDPSAEPALTQKCMALIKKAKNVQYVPRLKEMPKFYQGIDILLSNSTYESQGVAILEAMASGAHPLIRDWSQVPGVAGSLYPKENIFHSIEECRRKILWWKRKAVNEKRQLSRNLREYVKKHYNANVYCTKMRNILERCGK